MEIDAVRMFVRVAEQASFTRAAEHLGVSKGRVSTAVQALETELGCRLLQRSTRAVRLTDDGEQFLARARAWVAEGEELSAMFQTPGDLRGTVRVDAPNGLVRSAILPQLPSLLAAHPLLDVYVSSTDRRVDVVREGFDCVLRVGRVTEPGLTVRRLGTLTMINCASPAYLARMGVPRTLDDLDGHLVVHYASGRGVTAPGFEYRDGDVYRERPMRARVTVNNSDAYTAACLAGLGIIQSPCLGMIPRIAAGELVEVLPQYASEPMPVSLVHAHGRRVPRHVRAVMTWIAQQVTPHLA